MNLLLDLDVQNPNRFDLTFQSFEYTIRLSGEEVGNGRLEKALLIPSSATTRIQVPVAARFKDLSGILKAILTKDDLPYKIEGKVTVKTVLGNRQFPFSNEGRINLKN
jgi:LEA14-like dessication related protein